MDLHIAVLGKENTDILCRYLCREAIFQIIEVSNHSKKKNIIMAVEKSKLTW